MHAGSPKPPEGGFGFLFWRRWFGRRDRRKPTGEVRLIVGLGNPGADYADTRHNAGFLLIDRLIERFGARDDAGTNRYLLWRCDTGGKTVFLMKPTTYMNLSGHALAEFLGKHQVGHDKILVAYDDVDLPLGVIRLRQSGSGGGQKGMRHIIECLASKDIPRLRIGIRTANLLGRPLAEFVLEAFGPEEKPLIREALTHAADACTTWLQQDMAAVMAVFNARASSTNKKTDPDASPDGRRDS